MKRQTIDWEKIFINHLANKGLDFNIKNSPNSTGRKQTTQLKNDERLEQTLSKRVCGLQISTCVQRQYPIGKCKLKP